MIRTNQVVEVGSEKTCRKHDNKSAQGAAFANGEYCPVSEAMMPLSDMGFVQSDAAYEKATVSNECYFTFAGSLRALYALLCEVSPEKPLQKPGDA